MQNEPQLSLSEKRKSEKATKSPKIPHKVFFSLGHLYIHSCPFPVIYSLDEEESKVEYAQHTRTHARANARCKFLPSRRNFSSMRVTIHEVCSHDDSHKSQASTPAPQGRQETSRRHATQPDTTNKSDVDQNRTTNFHTNQERPGSKARTLHKNPLKITPSISSHSQEKRRRRRAAGKKRYYPHVVLRLVCTNPPGCPLPLPLNRSALLLPTLTFPLEAGSSAASSSSPS